MGMSQHEDNSCPEIKDIFIYIYIYFINNIVGNQYVFTMTIFLYKKRCCIYMYICTYVQIPHEFPNALLGIYAPSGLRHVASFTEDPVTGLNLSFLPEILFLNMGSAFAD